MSASLAPECSEAKEKYDTCFIKWYSEKYLKGDSRNDECAELFRQYQTCLKKALVEKGIYDMIEDARREAPNGSSVRKPPA